MILNLLHNRHTLSQGRDVWSKIEGNQVKCKMKRSAAEYGIFKDLQSVGINDKIDFDYNKSNVYKYKCSKLSLCIELN